MIIGGTQHLNKQIKDGFDGYFAAGQPFTEQHLFDQLMIGLGIATIFPGCCWCVHKDAGLSPVSDTHGFVIGIISGQNLRIQSVSAHHLCDYVILFIHTAQISMAGSYLSRRQLR